MNSEGSDDIHAVFPATRIPYTAAATASARVRVCRHRA